MTLPISDSLSAAMSCIEARSLSTANAELVELEPEELDELPVALEAPVLDRPEEVPVALALDPEEPDPLEALALVALVVP